MSGKVSARFVPGPRFASMHRPSGRESAMKKNAATKPVMPAKPVKITRPNDRDIFGTWIRGYEAGDVSLLMSIFSENLSYLAPCEPEQTFASLAAWFKYDFARKDPRPT